MLSTSRFICLILIGLRFAIPCGTTSADEPFYESEVVFVPSEELHGHVHASTILECPNGDLRVVWYENGPKLPTPRYYNDAHDKNDNVRISGSRKAKNSDIWEAPFVMSDTFGTADNNPTMVIDKGGKLWLFHSTMLGVPKWTWGSSMVRYKISSEYDQPGPPKWELSEVLIPHPVGIAEVVELAAKELDSKETRDAYGLSKTQADAFLKQMREAAIDPMQIKFGWMPRVHPLIRSDGMLVLPLSNENFEIPMMAMTKNFGRNWTYSKPVPGLGLLQPTLVEFPNGDITAFFRNGDPRARIKRSHSTDGGMTWSVPELTDRLHPGGGIEALLLKNGNLVLAYNNKETSPRDKLAISISTDQGRTWKWTRQLEDTPNGRFDYPSIIQTKDGLLHVSYSYHLGTIKHVTFNEAWVREGNE